jgi:hypothetical protein
MRKIKRDLSELMEKWIEIPTFLRKKWMMNETVEEEFVPMIKEIERIKKKIEKLGGKIFV